MHCQQSYLDLYFRLTVYLDGEGNIAYHLTSTKSNSSLTSDLRAMHCYMTSDVWSKGATHTHLAHVHTGISLVFILLFCNLRKDTAGTLLRLIIQLACDTPLWHACAHAHIHPLLALLSDIRNYLRMFSFPFYWLWFSLFLVLFFYILFVETRTHACNLCQVVQGQFCGVQAESSCFGSCEQQSFLCRCCHSNIRN